MMNEFCKGGGCTAKLGPGILDKVLKMIPKKADPNLLVGFDHSDDAAVYQLTDELAVVQTLDFFPPMVEDPYLFGQIAATNALSDIYAMGGEVKTALNIVCFPESMDANILGQILLGGNEKVTEAGGVLAGGGCEVWTVCDGHDSSETYSGKQSLQRRRSAASDETVRSRDRHDGIPYESSV